MCSCKGSIILGVETTEWGPHYWNVLHFLSLKAGTAQPRARDEEQRTWIRIIQKTGLAIPCADCRAHYKDWLLRNPVKTLETLGYEEKGEWIRLFFYNLHSEINIKKGNDSANIPYESVLIQYKTVNLLQEMATVSKYVDRATHSGQLKIMDFKDWKRQCITVNSLYY